ncbi:MAG TPA: pseudouridine synthase [Steroidobacteraceae bacterium]|nr:pseudouridine synthase [Steroidobacteraceae bacterium]
MRLQKALADAGVAARRDCEQLIFAGRVRVNGRVVDTLPAFVDPSRDVVEVDGQAIDLSASEGETAAAGSAERVYLLVNKPKGVVTTTNDPQGRRNVMSLVPRTIAARERLFPVGRLDVDSTGLLLLTNDGELAFRLTHPRFGLAKEYRVLTSGLATDEQLAKLRQGMRLTTTTPGNEPRAKRATMESVRILKRYVDRSRGDRTLLSVVLREGQNREIRRMLARVGLKVRELERVAIGPLRAPDLKPGQVKLLGRKDVDRLRAATLGAPEPLGQRRGARARNG